jgi:hypothetical protein
LIPASEQFIKQMKSSIKQLYVKLELFDSNMSFIKEITQKVTRDSIGSISVNADRPIRRSFSFSLVNNNNEFDWGDQNLVWIDKRVKLYTGLKLSDGTVEYVPQGVFILTSPSDSHNFQGKIANITGQDKGYLMTGSRGKFVNETTIETGVKIVDAIRIIAEGAGETLFNFDDGITATVPYELTYQSNDNRWKAIEELAKLAKCDIFYDVNGYLRLRKIDLNEFETEPIQWSYKYGDTNERFYAGNVRRMEEGILANHIRVLGGSGQTATTLYDLVVDENDTNWTGSPYTVQNIGRVLYEHQNGNPDGLITTNDEAKWRAKFELRKRLGFTERLELSIAPNFLHDVHDIIEIIDSENSVTGKYLIKSFQLPLNPQLMTIECLKYRKIISNWNFI